MTTAYSNLFTYGDALEQLLAPFNKIEQILAPFNNVLQNFGRFNEIAQSLIPSTQLVQIDPTSSLDDEQNSLNADDILDLSRYEDEEQPAELMYNQIKNRIQDFQRSLKSDEFGIVEVVSADGVKIRVTDIAYETPYTICYSGYDAFNSRCCLVQHISQVNYLITALKKSDCKSVNHKIGFLADIK